MADARSEKFIKALSSAKVPVLVLDKKWYILRQKAGTTSEINKLEEELKTLLKRQGKLTNEINAIKKLKKDLMSDIVTNMDDGDRERDNKVSDKKLDDKSMSRHEYENEVSDGNSMTKILNCLGFCRYSLSTLSKGNVNCPKS